MTFVVARAVDSCIPAIECTTSSLERLFKECEKEKELEAHESPAAPRTPTHRIRRRQKNPLIGSPSAASPRSSSKKNDCKIHHDKKAQRIQARWRDPEGALKTKSFPLRQTGDAAVAQTKAEAREFARKRHRKS